MNHASTIRILQDVFPLGIILALVCAAETMCCASVRSRGDITSCAFFSDAAEMVITDRWNNKTIRATVRQILTLRLNVIPSTGSSWFLAEIDHRLLREVTPPELKPLKKPRPGGRTVQIFRFAALKSGTTSLKLEYRRQTHNAVSRPPRQFVLKVDIVGM